MINREIASWGLAVSWVILAVWLLLQPLKTWAAEDEVATKAPKGTHGWIYNKKTNVLQFCTQVSGDQYDAMAEVLCIPYPKKVKELSEYDSFFLDGGPSNFKRPIDEHESHKELHSIPKYLPAEK